MGNVSNELVPVQAGRLVRLKDVGRNEFWLQDWLAADLARLGLGPLALVEQEQTQVGGGNLDILAAAGDTYYSIEVQLGEVDASHSFRVFDYWARNRRRFPNKTHVAVLVAESTGGRFRIALEELAEYVPLLVVELRSWQGSSEVVIVPDLVVTNDSVDVSGTPLAVTAGQSRTETDWKDALTEDAWLFHLDFAEWAREHLGPIVVDYSPKSYIGIRVGRRVWAPLWPRKDGAQIYLPDPDQSRGDESPAFAHFRELLAERGYTLNWQTTYNAGANPVAIRLRRNDLNDTAVHQLLEATYRAVHPGAGNWSETASVERQGAAGESPLELESDAGEGVPGLADLPDLD
ncbi:hypothetical protein GCM10009858_45150 [Terrabacter carboxydivorans]|uniref:DUF4268 domain-containing protein n=1 Tax=Terrabacter carboxydivorans TaxID=619730 RepID=A0ABN3MH95_9MICO